MKRLAVILAVCSTLSLVTTGCAKQAETTTNSAPSPDVSTAAASAGTTAPSSATAAATVAATAAAAPAPSQLAVAFDDIAGADSATAIKQLGALGVLDQTTGHFAPNDAIKRRDFVRWLFKTNNAVWSDTPARLVHAAATGETSDFSDVATSDPDFAYIQGMSDAGISVGFPNKTFVPDGLLTREQMLAIKEGVDRGGVAKSYHDDLNQAQYVLPSWKDKAQISKTFLPAIATDVWDDHSENKIDNIGRTFGAIAMLRPKQTVTRGQAAVVMTVIGAHSDQSLYAYVPRTVAGVLNPQPSPTP